MSVQEDLRTHYLRRRLTDLQDVLLTGTVFKVVGERVDHTLLNELKRVSEDVLNQLGGRVRP